MWLWSAAVTTRTGRTGRLYCRTLPRWPGKHLFCLAISLVVLIILLINATVLPRRRSLLLGEFEKKQMCHTKLEPGRGSLERVCPQNGIVTTVHGGGRLGNKMWEYASVWALARRTGLEPFAPSCIRSLLNEVFAGLTVPHMAGIAHCPIHLNNVVAFPKHWSRNQSIVLPHYLFQEEIVLTWVADIRREFKFRTHLAANAQSVLRKAVRQTANVTFVGVHIRRTDYDRHLRIRYHAGIADVTFYKQAMSYFRKRYHPVVFIIASDDSLWCRERLSGSDIVVVSGFGSSAEEDLATLAACNHSIIDYGTYGSWGAILAGGETILYKIAGDPSAEVAKMLPQWQFLSWQNETGSWQIEQPVKNSRSPVP